HKLGFDVFVHKYSTKFLFGSFECIYTKYHFCRLVLSCNFFVPNFLSEFFCSQFIHPIRNGLSETSVFGKCVKTTLDFSLGSSLKLPPIRNRITSKYSPNRKHSP